FLRKTPNQSSSFPTSKPMTTSWTNMSAFYRCILFHFAFLPFLGYGFGSGLAVWVWFGCLAVMSPLFYAIFGPATNTVRLVTVHRPADRRKCSSRYFKLEISHRRLKCVK